MYSWDRHDRLSVIAALSRSARRRRVRLHFPVYEKNTTAEEAEVILRQVQRSLSRRLTVVLDGCAVYRSHFRFQHKWPISFTVVRKKAALLP